MKNLESIIKHYWSTTIAFLPSSHTRSLQIKASRSLLRTQGTSRYYAKFLLQISFPSLSIELDIKNISFTSNPHIRFLQIKAFRVTTPPGNFKVLCNISLTNFVPSASNQIRHHINIYHYYQILISDSSRSRLTGSLLQIQGTSEKYVTFLSQISFLPLLVT